jgi:threonine/homoserine/homoserine lactone efflux protein
MTFTSIFALFGAMFALAIIPDTSAIAVVARSIGSGFTHGLATTVGIIIGDLVFIIFAVLGLWFLAETMGNLFVLVKYLGSTYLIGLGISLWISKSKAVEVEGIKENSWVANILCGLFITLGDPKAILFYISFLPAFVDLSTISIFDTGIIMVTAILVVGWAKLTYAYMADKARLLFISSKVQKRMNITAGSVMICTGIFLVVKT